MRNARLNHTCKISRINAMRNRFHYLLIRSDPVTSSLAFKNPKTIAGPNFDPDALDLLKGDEQFKCVHHLLVFNRRYYFFPSIAFSHLFLNYFQTTRVFWAFGFILLAYLMTNNYFLLTSTHIVSITFFSQCHRTYDDNCDCRRK